MVLYIDGHDFGYELRRLCSVFVFGEPILIKHGAPPDDCGDFVYTRRDGGDLYVSGRLDGAVMKPRAERLNPGDTESRAEHCLGRLLYDMLGEATGFRPVWGVLTGVRPVKLLSRIYENAKTLPGFDEADWHRYILDDYRIDESRLRLALQTARRQQWAREQNTPESISLYVSIPYCPTRCAYCSFVSHSIEKAEHDIPRYLDMMCEELEQTAQITRELGLKVRTIYFGGGTPTTLSAGQLDRLLTLIEKLFDLSSLLEYTVEAGRPDTVTKQKLDTLFAHGVGRVSINPQTMSDDILRRIGRAHTAGQTLDAYELARKTGFKCINMDVIAGLPGDTVDGFSDTLSKVISLAPENITVHTLCIKRAARLSYELARGETELAGEMARRSQAAMRENGLSPYYLYRQSGALSSLENVGYARDGCDGLYNIYMMEECHSVFGVGAGASTKLCSPDGSRIERVYNYKYPYEYMSRFETVKARKRQIALFYENSNNTAVN